MHIDVSFMKWSGVSNYIKEKSQNSTKKEQNNKVKQNNDHLLTVRTTRDYFVNCTKMLKLAYKEISLKQIMLKY